MICCPDTLSLECPFLILSILYFKIFHFSSIGKYEEKKVGTRVADRIRKFQCGDLESVFSKGEISGDVHCLK
jgi:hypothetical protein